LAGQGVIGSLGENNYSFMGALRDTSEVVEQTGPEVARKLVNEGVEVAFLTPT
jgi:D-proline reductase (dithiol) PrdB